MASNRRVSISQKRIHPSFIHVHLNDFSSKEFVSDLNQTVSTQRIMDHLSSQFRNKIGFRRAKLFVLGDDRCGKTELIRMLTGDKNYNEQDPSIGFTNWKLSSSDEVESSESVLSILCSQPQACHFLL
jgi:hypothetical protein